MIQFFYFLLAIALAFSCQSTTPEQTRLNHQLEELQRKQVALEQKQYVPHLGWSMVQLQTYHAKLYFAGAAKNWELAAYYVHELEEALEEVQKFHPVHEGIKVGQLVEAIALPSVEKVEEAISQKDVVAFSTAFERLTLSCNQCHQSAGKSFIRILVPQNTGLPNQDFRPTSQNTKP
ncbi:MAG: hypothetical protein RMJ44_05190 [Cytophagales bacterium]|nr:hypothetical protein [Bernardetiaceae bacterium]MDW8210461.1 hypothetical protein [Cytophagales bacterium]